MESNLKENNYQNFGSHENAIKNNNFNEESFQNINDDFDYEKIQAILEEEEKNRKIRKEEERRKEKEKEREREKTRDRASDRDNRDRDRDRDKDRYKKKEKSSSIDRKKRDKDKERDGYRKDRSRSRDRKHSRRSTSRSRSRDRYRRDKEKKIKEKIMVEKTIEEAKRQAIEAQRDDCTILVYRLHLNAKEKDLFKFFTGANIGKVVDIKVIRDPRTGRSKGAAYVEFEQQESVMLAVAMSGQQVLGQAVTIQHSQAEKNRLAAAAKYKKEMIKEQQKSNRKPFELGENIDGPMKIYVGGLTEHLADITDMDLRSIFSPFGEIDLIDMPRDPNTMKSKGYCFIQFRHASQAQAAIQAMNGFKYKGKMIKVGIAHEEIRHGNEIFTINAGIDEESHLHNLQSKQALMQKLSREGNMMDMGAPLLNQNMSLSLPQPINTQLPGVPQATQSHCVLLHNLFDLSSINFREEPNFFKDTQEDVFEECSNFGKVEDVHIDQNSKGNIYVKFSNNNWQAAKAAVDGLNGRWFASRPISAVLIPEVYFDDCIRKIKN